MLLVLRNWCLPLDHLHFHSARNEQLAPILSVLSVRCAAFSGLSLEDGVVLGVSSISSWALMVSLPLCRLGWYTTTAWVVWGRSPLTSNFRWVLVVSIEFMYVQWVSSLVHVRVLIVCVVGADEVAVNLNGLGSVAFLGIELAAVHTMAYVDRLDEKSSLLLIMMMGRMVSVAMMVTSVSLLRYHGLSCWIETKVGLGH